LAKIDLVKEDINYLNKISQINKVSGIKVMLILNMQGTSPIVAGLGTSGDGFINMTGASNAANQFEGWKPISSEAIISYNPDYIIITNRGMSSFPDVQSLANTTSLRLTSAAQNGRILQEDGMAMLGFGTRTISTAIQFAKVFSE
jgi:iron complex transport system substrate-binding protein